MLVSAILVQPDRWSDARTWHCSSPGVSGSSWASLVVQHRPPVSHLVIPRGTMLVLEIELEFLDLVLKLNCALTPTLSRSGTEVPGLDLYRKAPFPKRLENYFPHGWLPRAGPYLEGWDRLAYSLGKMSAVGAPLWACARWWEQASGDGCWWLRDPVGFGT